MCLIYVFLALPVVPPIWLWLAIVHMYKSYLFNYLQGQACADKWLRMMVAVTDVVETCVALYSYTSTVGTDLTFNKGDVITIVKEDGEWWSGSRDGRTGMFPANYVKKLAPASKVTLTKTCLLTEAFDSIDCLQIR